MTHGFFQEVFDVVKMVIMQKTFTKCWGQIGKFYIFYVQLMFDINWCLRWHSKQERKKLDFKLANF
jgi:hypothetical protein